MATHSIFLPEKILWTEEPGGLQSMRSQTVGHNLTTDHHPRLRMVITMVWSLNRGTGVGLENA